LLWLWLLGLGWVIDDLGESNVIGWLIGLSGWGAGWLERRNLGEYTEENSDGSDENESTDDEGDGSAGIIDPFILRGESEGWGTVNAVIQLLEVAIVILEETSTEIPEILSLGIFGDGSLSIGSE
jgi:hypothetical protein